MNTVTGIIIENTGKGYVNGTFEVVYNLEHGPTKLPSVSNLFVDITVNVFGEVLTAVPVDGKTGLNFSIDDLVFVKPVATTTELCILKITSIEGP